MSLKTKNVLKMTQPAKPYNSEALLYLRGSSLHPWGLMANKAFGSPSRPSPDSAGPTANHMWLGPAWPAAHAARKISSASSREQYSRRTWRRKMSWRKWKQYRGSGKKCWGGWGVEQEQKTPMNWDTAKASQKNGEWGIKYNTYTVFLCPMPFCILSNFFTRWGHLRWLLSGSSRKTCHRKPQFWKTIGEEFKNSNQRRLQRELAAVKPADVQSLAYTLRIYRCYSR